MLPTIVLLLIVVRNGVGFSNVTEMWDIAYYALVIVITNVRRKFQSRRIGGSSSDYRFQHGIGKAIALEFANKGHKVVVNARDEREMNSTRNNYSIINISSIHECIPQAQSAPYSASKGGMEMLTKTVALEVAGKGIRVNGIAPGAIATDMNRDNWGWTEKERWRDDDYDA